MNVKTLCACRGDGRSYMSVKVTQFAKGSRLKLTGSTSKGNHVPTQLYILDETDESKVAVLVFPLATSSLELILKEIGGDGGEIGTRCLTVKPSNFKWKSRINYRLKSSECARIRDIDKTDYYRHATIEIAECIPSKDSNIIRGIITLPTTATIPYSISLLDSTFEVIETKMIVMNDAIIPESNTVPTALRQISFSLRIPQAIQTYVIGFVDSSNRIRSNFATIEPAFYQLLLEQQHAVTLNASHDPRYATWLSRAQIDNALKKEQHAVCFKNSPLISIVVPLYRTPRDYFDAMAASVLDQTYDTYELVLVNADPTNEYLAQAIEKLRKQDNRVKEIRLEKNLGISLNTAQGIARAQGEYIAFLDHDDLIEPNALYEYVDAINNDSSIDLFYCDEDKLYPHGGYGDPYFKPSFSPHLLREVNYICHFLMIRKELLDQLDAADSIYDGAQDHRMILQAVARGAHVHHVPSVLYHWRISEGSTASGTNEKPYADKAGKLALEEHLKAISIPGNVNTTTQACRYRIDYHVTGNPLVSIIIPSKDNTDVLDVCLSSILNKSTYTNFEIVIVENNSTDNTTFEYYKQVIQKDPRIRIITWEHEFNFSKLINFGAQHAKGDFLLLLNNDTEVISSTWIETMLSICQEDEVGAVGAKLYYRDGTIQHAGVYVQGDGAGHLNLSLDRNDSGYFNTATSTREVSAVTAACVLTKRTAFDQVEGFSEQFAVAFNDVDFCLKLRDAGYSIVFAPTAELYHYESLSRGYESTSNKRIRFRRETSLLNAAWPEYHVLGDPFMNTNLHPNCGYFRLDDRTLD